MSDRVRVLITTPLERDLVEAIAAVDPRLDVVYPQELMAPIRYASDHPFPPLDGEGVRAQWDTLLDGAQVLFDFGPLDLAPMLRSRPRLEWIQATSAGVGRFAERLGLLDSDVVVTTASGVHARPLAEFALLGMLLFGKDALRLTREQQDRRWQRHAGEEIRGKVVCVVGLGSIGIEVARLAHAFDARVTGVVRELRGRTAAELGVDELTDSSGLDRLLGDADVVVLATPHTQETHRLLDARRIGLLKPGAVVVNVARGDVIEEAALVEALATGRLRGAALDVFEQEPLPPESPLWGLPNVFVSPHSASTVAAENGRIVDLFRDNLARYLRGEELVNVLDKELLY
jgi:phosphoglycerate dehydrogenase-like enzyme